MKELMITFACISIFVAVSAEYKCASRSFGFSSQVCVCNATFCGTIEEKESPATGTFDWYVSDMSGERLKLSTGQFEGLDRTPGISQLFLNREQHYQKIEGWGGAFSDSATINIGRLKPDTQSQLMQAYFGKNGSRYNLGRVPIAGTDFSTRAYTYDEVEGDVELEHFSLQDEDTVYKIPTMQKALSLNPELKFVASSWSAPRWMKVLKEYGGFGFLKREYYQAYAEYLIKFLDEYKKHNISFWGLSTGNEPTFSPGIPLTYNSMSWTTKTTAQWIMNNLGPTLAISQHEDTEIQCFDDLSCYLPHHIQLMFDSEEAKYYVKSIGIHSYGYALSTPMRLDKTHELFPNHPLLMTEASTGWGEKPVVKLGSWERAESYMYGMITSINHWVVGWIDWNLVLDQEGGPSWANSTVDALIIVDPKNDQFFKQPLYYAMTHFSRFVPRGSVRLHITEEPWIIATAFQTPEGNIVIVMCYFGNSPRIVAITDSLMQKKITVTLSPRSFNTFIYKASSYEQ